ncbi:MAG: hypothetical protein GXY86_05675, partial [Firmicutes bacterium]|nr:hypothetical protein [Bacillota bacterium]
TNDGYCPQEFTTVKVVFHDDQGDPHKSADVLVFVDKSIKDIDEIKATAIKQAKEFLSHILSVTT